MRKQQKSILVLAIITAFVAAGVFLPKLIGAGELEPSAAPGPTMKTLDQIYDKLEAIESKIDAITPSFIHLEDGTVRDNATGLIWLKNANCFGIKNWVDAMAAAASLADGQCGLTDGSVAGDWRLPTKAEWEAFVDTTYTDPALCNAVGGHQWSEGDAFDSVQSNYYWSSTEYEGDSTYAWYVHMFDGFVHYLKKTYYSFYVWPVRGGN